MGGKDRDSLRLAAGGPTFPGTWRHYPRDRLNAQRSTTISWKGSASNLAWTVCSIGGRSVPAHRIRNSRDTLTQGTPGQDCNGIPSCREPSTDRR